MASRVRSRSNKSGQHNRIDNNNPYFFRLSVFGSQVCGGLADDRSGVWWHGVERFTQAGVRSPRPDLVYQSVRVFTSSFPSEHAELSAIGYLTVAALLAQNQSSFKILLYFIVLGALLTMLIGVSRVYLGVHYPTDVLGGWCVGVAWALGCWQLMTWIEHRD
jgi:membrane-associated phospholipid phosphatase